jgi:hypothetical protein
MHQQLAHWLLLGQGVYYAFTGLWPLLHMPSFLAVTGPKTDLWLVRTVGALVLVVGGYLLALLTLDPVPVHVALLAGGCAVALAAIDIVYVSRRVIAKIYLADAAAELLLLLLWVLAVIVPEGH